jgi:quercetin dioxygenase-like cupin family protein
VAGSHALRLSEDRFAARVGYSEALPARPRVLFVLSGRLTVWSGAVEATVDQGKAWFGVGDCTAKAGPDGAKVLRYELLRASSGPGTGLPSGSVVGSKLLLHHPIDLDTNATYLIRCDRVDFEPGGEALPHGHRGGGIRCLLAGRLDVKVAEGPFRILRPGDAWFESGQEPVHAVASKEEPTSFIRVSILPREIQGKSSIVYVNPGDAARSKPRRYTLFVDDPIEI